MAGSIEFRLLGGVEAVRDGDLLPLGGSRQRALLALLLLEPGKPMSADRLAEELWAGRPPAGSATTLRSYVSRLRRALGVGAPLVGGPAGYALQVSHDSVDARRFERLALEGEEELARRRAQRAAELLREALDLWRGSPFPDLADIEALRLEGGRLEDLRLRVLERRAEADLALGGGAELVEELEALAGRHPYRERLWQHLMLALYRAGRQADALAAYRRAREMLDAHLGIEPGEELRQLEQAILRHDVPTPVPAEERHNLRAPLTSFVGRGEELARLQMLLHEHRLVTLTGVGGVGKTRLALEAARRALTDFPDGVYFCDLAPLSDPSLVVREVVDAVGLHDQSELRVEDALAAQLRSSEFLLVLDNCEHLRDACAALARTLLESCPRLRVLATSREVLGVGGEVDYPVAPLVEPEAARLFLVRAREARPQLAEDEAALASASRIARDLDGIPLAIELAGARAKALSLDEIARRLSDRFRFLVSWRRLTSARHRTLREAMDWSYELLSDDERTLLCRLAVFAGGFTLTGVAAVCSDGDEEHAVELVGRLADASLVVAEERDGEMRYRLLETVRQYAAERLVESGEPEDARRRHAEHFTELAEAADLRGPEQPRWIAVLDVELDNLRAAIEAAEGEVELRLVGALWRYWWVRGYVDEGRRHTDQALGRRGEASGRVLARALNGAAGLAWAQGDYGSADTLAREALDEAGGADAVLDVALAHNLIGLTAMKRHDYAEARRQLELSLGLGEQLGLELDVVTAKLNLGVVALESRRPEAAVPYFEDVLDYHRRHGVAQGVGFASINLGEATYRLGDPDRARGHFEEARAAFESVGFRAHVGHALQGLAAVELKDGRAHEASRLLGRASFLLEEVGAALDDFDPTLAAEVEAAARARLGDEAFEAAYGAGRQSSG